MKVEVINNSKFYMMQKLIERKLNDLDDLKFEAFWSAKKFNNSFKVSFDNNV